MGNAKISELKNFTCDLVARAAKGESIIITSHSRPIAVLSPLPPEYQVFQELTREGKMKWSGGKPSGLPPEQSLSNTTTQAAVTEAILKARR